MIQILALETMSQAPQLRTINVFISVSAGLHHEIRLGDSFKANVLNGSCSSNSPRKASLVFNKDNHFAWKWRSTGQFGAAQAGGKRFVSVF